RVEIDRASLAAELGKRNARDVDRKIEKKVAPADEGLQNRAMVLARERRYAKADAVVLGLELSALVTRDDRNAIVRHIDVAEQERQRALPDRTEADEYEPPIELDVLLVCHFINCLSRSKTSASVPKIATSGASTKAYRTAAR